MSNEHKILKCEQAIKQIEYYMAIPDFKNILYLCILVGDWIEAYIKKDVIYLKSSYKTKNSRCLWNHHDVYIDKEVNTAIHTEKIELLKRVIKQLKQVKNEDT